MISLTTRTNFTEKIDPSKLAGARLCNFDANIKEAGCSPLAWSAAKILTAELKLAGLSAGGDKLAERLNFTLPSAILEKYARKSSDLADTKMRFRLSIERLKY